MAYIGILEKAIPADLPFESAKNEAVESEKSLNEEFKILTQKLGALRSFCQTIEDLQSTPFCDDPGKNHRAVFLLNKKRERVVCDTVNDVDMSGHVAKINLNNLPKIKLEDTLQDNCPNCKKNAFILQIYHQTEDSPYGDTWMKNHTLLCPSCKLVYQVGQPEYRAHRF